jgi:hypothetical protein
MGHDRPPGDALWCTACAQPGLRWVARSAGALARNDGNLAAALEHGDPDLVESLQAMRLTCGFQNVVRVDAHFVQSLLQNLAVVGAPPEAHRRGEATAYRYKLYRLDQISHIDKLYLMPKSPQALLTMPPAAAAALRSLGENLAIARVRRRESQRAWSKRLGVSVPTLIRMERGDPGVAGGIYVTALWLMGRVGALPDVAAPAEDQGALESDVRAAMKRRAVRSAASIEARLGRGKRPRE